VGATVLSNDSFQEFHADYDWLFEPGRLIGGKPVPGVGWIFSLRRPVRGIVSRKTIQKAKQDEKAAKPDKKVQKAIAEATASAMEGDSTKRRRRRGGRGRTSKQSEPEPEAVNEPASFLQFVIDHRLGTDVIGEVDSFASHGAFVIVDGVKCYVPLSAMGSPQPTRARDVLTKGEARTFVVQAVDAPRRGIELGLPGFATVAGAPSEETVAAEVGTRRTKAKKTGPAKKAAKGATKKTAPVPAEKVAKKAAKVATKAAPTKQTAPATKAKKAKKAKQAKAAAAQPAKTPAKDQPVAKSAKKRKAQATTAKAPTPSKLVEAAKATRPLAKKAPSKQKAKTKAATKVAKQPAKRPKPAVEKPLGQAARQARKRR
jgi:hypothetical protein